MKIQSRTSVIVTPNKGIQFTNNFNPHINNEENIPLPFPNHTNPDRKDYRVDYPHGTISLFKLLPPFTTQNDKKNKEKKNTESFFKISTPSSSVTVQASYPPRGSFVPSELLPPRTRSSLVSKRIRTSQNVPLRDIETRLDMPNPAQISNKFLNISERISVQDKKIAADLESLTTYPSYGFWDYQEKRNEKSSSFSPPKFVDDALMEKKEIQSTFFIRDSPLGAHDGRIRSVSSRHLFLMPVHGWFVLSIVLSALLIFALIFCAILYKSWREKKNLILKLATSQDYIVKSNCGEKSDGSLVTISAPITACNISRPINSNTFYKLQQPSLHHSSSEQEDSSIYEESDDLR